MTFFTWMVRTYKNESSPLGDLAMDMLRDSKNFPRSTAYRRNQAYLEVCGACPGCMEAFEEAWKEYVTFQSGCRHA